MLIHRLTALNIHDRSDQSALRKKDLEAITTLVQKGEDINAVDNKGKTPLHYLLNKTNFKPEEIFLFLKLKANPEALKDKIKRSIDKDGIEFAKFNDLLKIDHKGLNLKSYALQGTIKESAFSALKESISKLSPKKQLAKLEWAKKQPIFCQHRSHFFLATIGKTNTEARIDKMINTIEKKYPGLKTTGRGKGGP